MKVNNYLHTTTSLYNNKNIFVAVFFSFFLEILQNVNSDGARTCHLESCLSRKGKRKCKGKKQHNFFRSHCGSHCYSFGRKLTPLSIIEINNILGAFARMKLIDRRTQHRTPLLELFFFFFFVSLIPSSAAYYGTKMLVATVTRTLSMYYRAYSNKNKVGQPPLGKRKQTTTRTAHKHTFPFTYTHTVAKCRHRRTTPYIPNKSKTSVFNIIPRLYKLSSPLSVVLQCPCMFPFSVMFSFWRREGGQCSGKFG